MRVIQEEADGISSVECPICRRNFRIISMTHLKSHGYTSKQEFLDEYPGTQLVSKEYEDAANEMRRSTLTRLNKSSEQRAKVSARAKEMNQDSDRQSQKGRQGWTDERRQAKAGQLRSVTDKVNNSPDYADVRERRLKGWSYGQKIPYETESGETIVFKSFLECRVCKFLELNGFDFEYEKVEVEYVRDGEVHRYYPDFYLKDYNLLIEVKPEDRRDSSTVELKRNAAENEGYNFLFVGSSELKRYEDLIQTIKSFG